MTQSAKPAWPDPSGLPFTLFGAQQPGAGPGSPPLGPPLAQGMDLIKQFWSNLPGGNALPGFLVPTVDVEELDKRLSDLRAAEKWLEVNLNMLRATIQGLEVQRNTIAAIHSLSAMAEQSFAGNPPAAAPTGGGLPEGWPGVAPAAAAAASVATEAPPMPDPPAAAPSADRGTEAAPGGGPLLAGLATNNWLGFMQEQFSKVAQAALAGSPPAAVAPKAAARKAPARPAAKKTGRRPAARKT